MLIPEAAAEVGVTRWAIWRYVKSGELKSRKRGRDRVIRRDVWEDFKARRYPPDQPRRGRPPKSSRESPPPRP